jgi:hypothetical protein
MKFAYFVVAGALLASASLHAQPAKDDAGDADWNSIQSLRQDTGSVASLIQDADRFKDFYSKHPNHGQAKNAKASEALMLLRAAFQGDTSQDGRRNQVAAAVRHDKNVDAPLRAEVFALTDTVSILRQGGLSRDARLGAFEAATRDLIAEFPDLQNGYESLLGIARDSSDAKAPVLAKELIGLSNVPAWIKTEAQLVADRAALVGQSLVTVTASAAGDNSVFAQANGRPVIVYSWRTDAPYSVARAKRITDLAPQSAVIVGVCLDPDPSGAQAQAASLGLPGTQLTDTATAVASALKFTAPGLIYAADSSGIIRTISAQNRLDSTQLFAGL